MACHHRSKEGQKLTSMGLIFNLRRNIHLKMSCALSLSSAKPILFCMASTVDLRLVRLEGFGTPPAKR